MNIQIDPAAAPSTRARPAWEGRRFRVTAPLTVEMASPGPAQAIRRTKRGRPRLEDAQLATTSRNFEAAGVSVEAARAWQASHLGAPAFGGFRCQWQTVTPGTLPLFVVKSLSSSRHSARKMNLECPITGSPWFVTSRRLPHSRLHDVQLECPQSNARRAMLDDVNALYSELMAQPPPPARLPHSRLHDVQLECPQSNARRAMLDDVNALYSELMAQPPPPAAWLRLCTAATQPPLLLPPPREDGEQLAEAQEAAEQARQCDAAGASVETALQAVESPRCLLPVIAAPPPPAAWLRLCTAATQPPLLLPPPREDGEQGSEGCKPTPRRWPRSGPKRRAVRDATAPGRGPEASSARRARPSTSRGASQRAPRVQRRATDDALPIDLRDCSVGDRAGCGAR